MVRVLVSSLALCLGLAAPSLAGPECGKEFNQARAALTRENEASTIVTSGAWYVVGPSATGDWAGHDNDWAFGDGTSWQFEEPCIGDVAHVHVDYIREGLQGAEIFDGQLAFDGFVWYVAAPGYPRYTSPFNANLVIAASELETATPIRLFKNDSNAYSWVLPYSVNEFYGSPIVVVTNDGASGDITITVATTPTTGLAGLIDGGASTTVTPQSSKSLVWIRNDGRGRWHTF